MTSFAAASPSVGGSESRSTAWYLEIPCFLLKGLEFRVEGWKVEGFGLKTFDFKVEGFGFRIV